MKLTNNKLSFEHFQSSAISYGADVGDGTNSTMVTKEAKSLGSSKFLCCACTHELK